MTVEAPPKKITTADIRAAMRKTWAAPEYAVLWEVAPATGYNHKARYADAMIMSLWPSRGLELHGVEIKVSRADWLREAKDPSKAEALAAFCDRWWIHTCPGVIRDLAEVPVTWGVREWDGRKWKVLREAEKTPANPCDRKFLASLMRRATESATGLARMMAEESLAAERAAIEERVEKGIAERAERKGQALALLEDLEAGLGFKLQEHGWGGQFGYNPAEVGALVRVIIDTGILNGWRSLATIIRHMDSTVDQIETSRNETLAKLRDAAGPYIDALDGVQDRKAKRAKRGLQP